MCKQHLILSLNLVAHHLLYILGAQISVGAITAILKVLVYDASAGRIIYYHVG